MVDKFKTTQEMFWAGELYIKSMINSILKRSGSINDTPK
jgi:hypothetical protein